MDPMCMEAILSLSSLVAVSSTLTSQVGLNTVSRVNSSSRVVPLASGGVCSLVGESIPPQPKGGCFDDCSEFSCRSHSEFNAYNLGWNALIGRVVLSSGERP
ncbi:hypothetical protein LWI28_021484 [Acer negundo]|uniref:Secreted protein n=1 Tax=Acer negundo TaxID=4023 RepID=A0AAD5NL98_ACENE|nr:hypothetical protein LWI28_021484 [Acer negundo]